MNPSHNHDMKQISIFKSIIPPLSHSLHKGQAGRIGIVGGSPEYTGAPYFASISSLRIGADLSYIFCAREAGPIIKSYSPELIVYPRLLVSSALSEKGLVESTKELLEIIHTKLDALVVGPGLSRDSGLFSAAKKCVHAAMEKQIPIVFDADGIAFLIENVHDLTGYPYMMLTPNIAEFRRLSSALTIDPNLPHETSAKLISQQFGNPLVILKGHADIITNGHELITCEKGGSPRRCGGQGDILSGALGVFSAWLYKRRINTSLPDLSEEEMTELQLAVGYSACRLVREASSAAFGKKKRSMLAVDMIEELGDVFDTLFENERFVLDTRCV